MRGQVEAVPFERRERLRERNSLNHDAGVAVSVVADIFSPGVMPGSFLPPRYSVFVKNFFDYYSMAATGSIVAFMCSCVFVIIVY